MIYLRTDDQDKPETNDDENKKEETDDKPFKHDSALEDWEEDYDYLDGTIFPRWG